MPSRLAVLASGRGSNLQAIIDHFDNISRERRAGWGDRRQEPRER
jgi:folate-dependent phosphoribosylglycinamide formyltransferase PurN